MSPKHLGKIAIGIGTYIRPEMLKRTLESLANLSITFDADLSLIVVDNDHQKSSSLVFENHRNSFSYPTNYFCEPKRGIVFCRNRIIEEALKNKIDYLAFIDDDEVADKNWLNELMEGLLKFDAAVSTGKVIQKLPPNPPRWALETGSFKRASHVTGTEQLSAGTSSVLFDMKLCSKWDLRFNPAFNLTGSEDTYFFEEAVAKGAKIVWIDEALVYEEIPPSRVTPKWVWKRSFRYGNTKVLRHQLRFGYLKALKFLPLSILKLIAGIIQWIVLAPFSSVHRVGKMRRVMNALGMLSAFFGKRYQEYNQTHGH